MELRQALTALREDDGECRKGQEAMARALAAWRIEPLVASVLEAMKRFGQGAALERCRPLAALFRSGGPEARAFADSFVAAGLAALDAHPLGQLRLPHGSRRAAPALLLAQSGRANLALAAYDGAMLERMPTPKTADFPPFETWIHVLSGEGEADLVLCRDSDEALDEGRVLLQSGTVKLEPGVTLYRHGSRETLQVRRARGSLVMLRLQRRFADAQPVREYSMPDGTLLHQAAAIEADSRRELAMSLLGRMGRRDAVPDMARIVCSTQSRSLRWEALRQILALDIAAGLALVGQVAADADDVLSDDARHLQAALLKTWPDLERIAPWQS